MKTLVALLLIILNATSALAADSPTLETLTAAQSAKLEAIFNQQQRTLQETCKTVTITRAKAIQVAQPLTLNTQNQPASGQWRVRFAVDACTKPALRMAEFTVTPTGIALKALTPGETLADPKLQDDVLKSLALSTHVMMPKCTEVPTVRDTKLQIHPATAKDRWVEIWIARACNRDVAQTVDFLPSKSGTIFKMSLPKAK